jgi:hypothetical protein
LNPGGGWGFFLRHRVQTGSEAHPDSYPMGTGGSFPGGKAAGGVKLTTHLHLMLRSKNDLTLILPYQSVVNLIHSVNQLLHNQKVQHSLS